MFERFTPPARQVVVHAQDEARRLGHDWIGTEHLVLGLLREEHGLAARVLASLGITADAARAHLILPGADPESRTTGQIQFTRGAVNALEGATDEADAMNHAIVGTEHLLLGLTGARDEAAERLLSSLGSSCDQVRSKTLQMLSGSA